ncbi:phage tail tape measure protein, partial [Marinagarivorans algicola]|uniref:hypothetical protein n=1 Tax=Marinagarivorans algicola TaxID=1513270 RepID=UPI0037360C2C
MSNSDSRSVIRFGAELGPIRQIGGVFNQQFNRARGSVSALSREQTRLLRSIERAQDAGEDVSDLTAEYEELGEAIADAERQVNLFNNVAGHASSLGRLATMLGGVAAVAMGVGSSIVGLGAATNLHTAEVDGMAKSYGMAIDDFNAWGALVSRAGLDAEHTGDLVEELGNKFGEFKALGKNSAVGEVFGALGVDQSMLEGLSAAQQFEFIMKRLQRVKDTQQAASLADILFGGEANKVVTYIRGTGQSIDDLLGSQKKFNLLTAEGAKGATAYSQSFSHLRSTVSTAWAEIAGIAGGEMTGEIDALTQSVGGFVRENKTELVGTLKRLSRGVREFVGGIVWAASSVNSLVQGLGGWQVVGGAVASLLSAKLIVSIGGLAYGLYGLVGSLGAGSVAMAAFNFIVAANPIGLAVVGVAALIGAGWA